MNIALSGRKIIAIAAGLGVFAAVMAIILALFRPHQEYRISPQAKRSTREFVSTLEALTFAPQVNGNRITPLFNGDSFYEAELAAIDKAENTIHIEAYIVKDGDVLKRFVQVLSRKAKEGVKVRIVADAVGSRLTMKGGFKELTDAGGAIHFYHAVRWYSLDRLNRRTHRQIVVIDGKRAFVGGAGIADHWLLANNGAARWRDTMLLIEGPAAAWLDAVFAENWLEASGEVLSTIASQRPASHLDGASILVVKSSASASTTSHARILFQMLISAAEAEILITTPYFLPDVDFRDELLRARERGVGIKVLTPNESNDHRLTRSASRRLYGDLLAAGVEIFEYQPAMMHQKLLVIDRRVAILGSTNIDNRSFQLNDEVNVAVFDATLADALVAQFEKDLGDSVQITYVEWRDRPWRGRAMEILGRLIERQQ